MASIAKSIRHLADPTRVRLLRLLQLDELSVAELQEILSMGQSRISSHLSQLRQADLVLDRRSGKRSLYRLAPRLPTLVLDLVTAAAAELPESNLDDAARDLVLKKRNDSARAYFDALAGKFGRHYVPGRSWKALAETLLKLLPPLRIADLGAGEGTLSQLLAQRASHVIAVDISEKMVEFGTRTARENGFNNLEFRLGDLESPPIEESSIDLALFSQSLHHALRPARALAAAAKLVRPGGRVVVLDLLAHGLEEARDLYADQHLGFSEAQLLQLFLDAGLTEVELAIVHREPRPPHFQSLLAIGHRPL
jgi:ubiquinone/menaquinone biosynthesis C-methylase UbiE